INNDFKLLEAGLREQLIEDAVNTSDISMLRFIDCRYVGQGYELKVPLNNEDLSDDNINEVINRYHEIHKQEYGHSHLESNGENINMIVTEIGNMRKLKSIKVIHQYTLNEAIINEKDVFYNKEGKLQKVKTKLYDRNKLPINTSFYGPAIVMQEDTTTIIPP